MFEVNVYGAAFTYCWNEICNMLINFLNIYN